MKKAILFLSLISVSFFACKNETEKEPNPLADSLANVNDRIMDTLSDRNENIAEFIAAFNEIQDNLSEIKNKQNLISGNGKNPEKVKNSKDQIIEDIQTINELMEKNKDKLASLQSKLRKSEERAGQSDAKVAELEKFIAHLNDQMAAQVVEIDQLKMELEKMNLQMTDLNQKYQSTVAESKQKTNLLNTAWYAIGTTKELIAKGVITKEGGIIGIGKSKKLSENLNKEYFTKIDITEKKTIPISAKKAKLLSNHPAGSYVIAGDKVADKLVINNVEEFWSSSKYLVILIEKQ